MSLENQVYQTQQNIQRYKYRLNGTPDTLEYAVARYELKARITDAETTLRSLQQRIQQIQAEFLKRKVAEEARVAAAQELLNKQKQAREVELLDASKTLRQQHRERVAYVQRLRRKSDSHQSTSDTSGTEISVSQPGYHPIEVSVSQPGRR